MEKFEPYEYQSYCIDRMVSQPRLCLMLDMGLGKTVITLTALARLYEKGAFERALIVAPKRVADGVWGAEAEKWEHLKGFSVNVATGSDKQRLEALRKPSAAVVISRDCVRWLVEECKKRKIWCFDCLVIDELTSFKHHNTFRYKYLKKTLPYYSHVYGLTGTPVANGLRDLFAQMYIIDNGASLGKSLTAYTEEYFNRRQINAAGVCVYEPKAGIEDKIRERIKDYCISMKAKDYLTLPRLMTNHISVDLEASGALSKYRHMAKNFMLALSDDTIIDAVSAGALANKLLQIASGAVYDDEGNDVFIHDEKIKMLKEKLEALDGSPLLVFYNFRHEKSRIIEALKKDYRVASLDSAEEADNWNAGKYDVLLAHPASCAFGLNLQHGGNNIMWFSPCWSLELYQQANARLYRQGQAKPVVIHHLISRGTIDEKVMAALRLKDVTQERLLKALKAELNSLKS